MDVKVMLATGKLTSKNRLKKIPQVKETYDNLESKLFKERLNRIIEPQDKIDLRRKLEGFERFRVNQEGDREAEQRNDRLTEHRDQKERRDIELDKMRRVINFNKDWNERGEQTWKQIMEKQRGLEKEEKEAFMKRTTKMKARSMMKKEEFVSQVFDELDNFEKRHLEEKETDIETSQGDHLDGVGSGYDNNYLGISQNMSMRRQALEISQNHEELGKLIQVREKEMHSEFFRKERDKRRRKMIVDQSKGQKKLEITRKKHGLLEKMIQESRQEEEIRYEFWRTRKAKDLIVANRGLRDNMYANRGVYINQRENHREETILEHMIGDFKSQVDLYLKREKTLRINKDIDKRDGNYSKCRKIVDILLNIADSCYEHNQDTDAKDAEQIEPNFWDENLSLLKSSLSPFLYRNPRNKISTDIFTEEFDEKSKYSHFLDLELSQYLGARGQWRVKSIKDPKSHQQPVDSKDPLGESSRVKIPKAPVNNELLGNLVAKLIDQKFPELEKQAKPEYPFYLPVKLCLIGKFYSGKSTVTRYLQNKFNLEIISVEEIVNQGIVRFGNCDDSFDHKEELDQHAFLQNGYASLLEDKPLDMLAEKNVEDEELLENKSFDRGLGDEAVSQHIQLGGDEGEPNPSEFIPETEEGVEEGQHGDEEELARSVVQHEKPATEKLVRNPVKSLIRKLFRGQEPSDADYALIIIDEIKRRHPFMTEEEFYRMMTDRRTSLVRQEKDRIIKEQEQTNEKVNLTRQKVDMNEKRKNIQIDEEQFTLVPPSGYVLLDFPNSYKQANVLENLMSRFLCRDKAVKTHAQIEKEFLLKLIKPSEKALPPKSLKESGFDMVMYMEASNSECLNRAFGDYQTSRNMHYHLVANPPPTNKTPLVETLQFNENQQKNQYLMADLNKNRSIDLPRVVDMYDHFGTNQDGIKTIRIVDANQDMTSLLADIDEIVSGIMQKKNQYYSSFASMLENSRKESERKQAENEEKAKKEAQMKLADPADLHSALLKSKEMMTKDPLRSDILDLLLNLWNLSSKSYVSKAQEVFTDIRTCREIMSVVIAEYQRAFIQYMETDDEKKQWLYEFQAMYNGFIDQNPDLLEQESVKEEFHQRVDDLIAKIYNFSVQKKEALKEERKRIMEDGFIEREMRFFTKTVHNLFQAEIDRHLSFSQLIKGYYRGVEQKPIEEFNGPHLCAITYDNLPEVEVKEGDHYAYPRLETLMENCIKIIEGKEVVEEGQKAALGKGAKPGVAAAKKPAAAAPPGKAGAKGGKPGAGGKVNEDENKEKSVLEKEMEESLELEKQGTAYRIMQIYTYALQVLNQMRARSSELYEKLNVWTEYAFKVDCDLMDELSVLLGGYIESEVRIQEQLKLTNYDLVLSKNILNFSTPPPIIRPAIESVHPHRFTIANLIRLKRELESLSDTSMMVESRDLLSFLITMQRYRPVASMLPKTWAELSAADFEELIANFDSQRTGKVPMNHFFTLICLQNTPLPEAETLDEYHQQLIEQSHENRIGMDEFVNTQAFFDTTQTQTSVHERSNKFDRVKHLKRLIFEINSDQAKTMNIETLMNILSCGSLNAVESEALTYFTAMFPGAEY